MTKQAIESRTHQLLAAIKDDISVSRDADTGQKWMWAGPVGDETDETTAACRELERLGVLADHDTEDGYNVWEITPEWRDGIR